MGFTFKALKNLKLKKIVASVKKTVSDATGALQKVAGQAQQASAGFDAGVAAGSVPVTTTAPQGTNDNMKTILVVAGVGILLLFLLKR